MKAVDSQTTAPHSVVIVGAGLSGLRTAQQLRALGYNGELTLIGGERHLPYDRPPLSKQLLSGEWQEHRVFLADENQLRELDINLELGIAATSVKPGKVELADHRVVVADAIVIATGARARRLPGQPDSVHCLRTLDEAVALRQALQSASSVVVVGGGFIGGEVASTAIALGCTVTVLEALSAPMTRVLGPEVGQLCGRLFTEGGVDLQTGAAVQSMTESAHGVCFELDNGRQIGANVGIVGIGGAVELEWLAGLEIDVSQGLLCGETGRVLGADRVWALGDVAAWRNESRGGHHRQEHWTAATEQAAIVARDILGTSGPGVAAPYVWSDQFGYKIQVLGHPEIGDKIEALHGSGLGGGDIKGTTIGYFSNERLVGIVAFSAPRLFNRYRQAVRDHSTRSDVLAFAAELGA